MNLFTKFGIYALVTVVPVGDSRLYLALEDASSDGFVDELNPSTFASIESYARDMLVIGVGGIADRLFIIESNTDEYVQEINADTGADIGSSVEPDAGGLTACGIGGKADLLTLVANGSANIWSVDVDDFSTTLEGNPYGAKTSIGGTDTQLFYTTQDSYLLEVNTSTWAYIDFLLQDNMGIGIGGTDDNGFIAFNNGSIHEFNLSTYAIIGSTIDPFPDYTIHDIGGTKS